MGSAGSESVLWAVQAKQEIRDVLSRYCRGLDRMDKDMAYAVFHPDSTARYIDIYDGTGPGFIDWVWGAHAVMARHSHQITNVLTEVDGDSAVSEAYVTVALWTLPDGEGRQMEIVGRGRYLDRWRHEAGRWAIADRVFVTDLQTVHAVEGAASSAESRRDREDPSFPLFAG